MAKNDFADLLHTLQTRFESNKHRHEGIKWKDVESRLLSDSKKIMALQQMEITGGEPDVVHHDHATGRYVFMDCVAETPAGRRSLCYDRAALDSRKENKPSGNAVEMAASMGIELMNEEQYRFLQSLGPVDLKTSSWLQSPTEIRSLGGAIFGDCRFGRVFVYHNGAQSYYAARGFRGVLMV